MVASLTYSDIQTLSPLEVVRELRSMDSFPMDQLQAKDLIVLDRLESPVNDLNYNDIYIKGIYILFDANGKAKYVGKSKNGFYGRLMGHLYPVARPGWGWNAILRKLGGQRLNIPHDELTTEDHEHDLVALLGYHLVLIDSENQLSDQQLGWLEKVVMKALRIEDDEHLLNSRIGWLNDQQLKQSIHELLTA